MKAAYAVAILIVWWVLEVRGYTHMHPAINLLLIPAVILVLADLTKLVGHTNLDSF